VGLARAFAAAWGNVLYGVEVAMDTEEKRRLRGWAWDLQTNTRVMMEDEFLKLVQRKQKDETGKVTGPAQWVTPDERDLRELTNRRGAILERNCLLKLLPPDRADEGATRCMIAEEGEIAGYDKPAFAETVKGAIAAFGKLGVSETQVLARVHKKDLASMTASDIVKLRAIMRGIDGGYTTVAAEFSATAATGTRSKVDDLRKPPKAGENSPQAPNVDAGARSPEQPGQKPGGDTPAPGVAPPPAQGAPSQGTPDTEREPGEDSDEVDDVELKIMSLSGANATLADVDHVIAITKYPRKEDPMKLFDKATRPNTVRQLSRLLRWYRATRTAPPAEGAK
jgi:hypothetical protein